MDLEPLCLTLLVMLIQALAYRVLPVLQSNYKQHLRSHGYGNRLPGLLLVLLFMPVLAWIPLRADDPNIRGTLCLILVWVFPSKFLSIAWDTPIDNLPQGFFYFAIANIIPVRIKGHAQQKHKSSTQFRSFNGPASTQFKDPTRSFNGPASISYSNIGSSGSFQYERQIQRGHSRSPNQSSRNFVVFPKLLFRLLQVLILIAIANGAYFLRGKVSIWFIYFVYCIYLYVWMDISWSLLGKIVELITGMETYPCFNDPYLASSLSEFWGRRWNLLVTAMLRSTVYDPILDAFRTEHKKKLIEGDGNLKPKKPWRPSQQSRKPNSADPVFARAVATMASFIVSGLLHEVNFCYINGSAQPTWEVTAFFVLHGFATICTIHLKKQIPDFKLPTVICRLLTLSFLLVTAVWLFMPQLTRTGADLKSLEQLQSLQSSATRLLSRPVDVLSKLLVH